MGRADFSYDFPHDRLITVDDLNPLDIQIIFERAEHWLNVNRSPDKKHDVLRGLTQINLFFEPSTRTLASFELAGKRLGADVVNFTASNSSTKKGETLADTARTLAAMRPDLLVVRHASTGAADLIHRETGIATINAGDGMHSHPTQGLLDLFALTRRIGDVGGKRILIVGDILHSRVARSDVGMLNLLGAEIRLCAPPTLLPVDVDRWGADIFHNLDDALEGCDAVITLRLQRERMSGAFIPSTREYFHFWGVSERRLELANPECVVMHPGPMNRNVEIDSALADHPERSLVLDQVEAGVAIRMAVLEQLGVRARKNEELRR
ncbi:aspartate carbamoyltransferase catalytic subunit [Hyphobacterium sp.]|uniref:aspartate carbamoyltransferase catalytic subunit n=1 Tax=Hyphobacterium sp. TaxID=2004662 RepID=UPI003BAD59E7